MKKFICLVVFAVISASVFCEALFTGDGRKDFSVQVESPELHNIGDDSAWIPDFVVNTISDDIGKYSNITVVDVQNAKKVAETQKRDEQGLANDSDLVEAGAFMVARNVLLVSITQKNSDRLSLSVRINDKEKNTSLASYSEPNCKFDDLEKGLAIKEAVADLLDQLGVKLTKEGKKKLLAVKSDEGAGSVAAQKLVAQGMQAMKNGSNVEALSYFIKANSRDANLQRAIQAMSQASTVLNSGDFTSQARNLIQQRKEFLGLISEFNEGLNKNPPVMIVFDKNLYMGKVDYENELVSVNVHACLMRDFSKFKLITSILNAYDYNSHRNEWNAGNNWNVERDVKKMFGNISVTAKATLSDKNGNQWKGGSTREVGLCDPYKWGSGIPGVCEEITISIPVPADADAAEFALSFDKAFIYGDFGSSRTNITCISEEDFEKIFGMPFGGEDYFGFSDRVDSFRVRADRMGRMMRGMYKKSYQGS